MADFAHFTEDGVSFLSQDHPTYTKVRGNVKKEFQLFRKKHNYTSFDNRELLVKTSRAFILAGVFPDTPLA